MNKMLNNKSKTYEIEVGTQENIEYDNIDTNYSLNNEDGIMSKIHLFFNPQKRTIHEVIITAILFIFYMIMIYFNVYFSYSDNECTNKKMENVGFNLSLYLFLTAVMRCTNYIIYTLNYMGVNYCGKHGLFNIFFITVIFTVNQIWTLIGNIMFFRNYSFYANNCLKPLFGFIFFDFVIRLFLFLFYIYIIIYTINNFYMF